MNSKNKVIISLPWWSLMDSDKLALYASLDNIINKAQCRSVSKFRFFALLWLLLFFSLLLLPQTNALKIGRSKLALSPALSPFPALDIIILDIFPFKLRLPARWIQYKIYPAAVRFFLVINWKYTNIHVKPTTYPFSSWTCPMSSIASNTTSAGPLFFRHLPKSRKHWAFSFHPFDSFRHCLNVFLQVI